MRVLGFAIIVAVFASSCSQPVENEEQLNSSSEVPGKVTSERENKPFLTMEQAALRSSRVSNVKYDLSFELSKKAKFKGTTKIRFELNQTIEPLTIDLDKAKINHVMVNGDKSEFEYNDTFITLAPNSLIKGVNEVEISYIRKHSTNGEGLHRFVDSVDDRVYLYSHFEPAAASQMFALFDQPDLKATYKLTVSAPKEWQVISAKRELTIDINPDENVWHFPESKKLSPYNFSLHAGPYRVWSDNSAKYPLRLFARQSIAEKIVPSDWFKYTQAGLVFFDDYFSIPYPFEKYDQVIVPDFIYGAMENAAAITFAERAFVASSEMSAAQKQRLASVIMHEMAHQWFGNLVTMKWWNGLWLNESFASFMGTLATAETTEFDYAWRSFYAANKQSAYVQDQRVTTHPIEVPVLNSSNAFDNIDAITYSKGASTLMQLRHLLGPEVFKVGVQSYLKQYAYKNAELQDFIGSLAKTAGRNLDLWTNQWLYESGVNTISPQFECKNNKVTSFSLNQSAQNSNGVLREQKVQVGLFKLANKKLELVKSLPIVYKGSKTAIQGAIGEDCPDLVYPNYQDWGFVKVNLDRRSFETAKQNLSLVEDPLLRSMLWQSLWDSVRDGELALQDYLSTALTNVQFEADYTILRQALGNISKATRYADLLGDKGRYFVESNQPNIEQVYWQKTIDNTQDINFQRRWFSAFVNQARSKNALSKLQSLLNGKLSIKGFDINQQYRWDIIYQLNRFDYVGSEELIESELKTDKGDSGQKSAMASRAIRPNIENKTKWLKEIHSLKSKTPFAKLRKVMSNLYSSEQVELEEQTAEQILNNLALMDKEKGVVFMRSYSYNLIPTTCSESSVRRLQKAIDNGSKLSSLSKRALLVAHQEDQRCIKIANKFLKESLN